MKAFDFLNTASATQDNKNGRKTMMLDKGMGLHAVDDLISTAGDYISFAKFGWGTAATMDRHLIEAKTARYRKAGIIPYPGGTLLEIAVANNQADAFFKEAELLGFQGIEVSDGSTTVDKETRRHLIKQARDTGFYVISEVGKKNPELDHEMSPAERVAEINDDLANGSNYVIIEAREAGKNIGIYDENGQIAEDELDALAANGIDQIMFEAPLKSQQTALILRFGNQINVGNVAHDEVTSLETLRRGLRADTIGKV